MIQNKAFENIFDDYILKKAEGLRNLILNDKKNYEYEFEKIINLKKKELLVIELPRAYDLLSDFTFEYEKYDEINFGEIKELPLDLNQLIKTYLTPKYDVDIFISNDSVNLRNAEIVNNYKKHIVKKKINLNMVNLGQSFLSYVANHLPIIALQYSRLYLKIISNKDTNLTFKCKGTMLNKALKIDVFKGKYLYQGENNTTIWNGLIFNNN